MHRNIFRLTRYTPSCSLHVTRMVGGIFVIVARSCASASNGSGRTRGCGAPGHTLGSSSGDSSSMSTLRASFACSCLSISPPRPCTFFFVISFSPTSFPALLSSSFLTSTAILTFSTHSVSFSTAFTIGVNIIFTPLSSSFTSTSSFTLCDDAPLRKQPLLSLSPLKVLSSTIFLIFSSMVFFTLVST